MEVNQLVTEVLHGAFRGLAAACKEARRAHEELPAWTKKTLAKIWNQASADHEPRNDIMRSATWKSTDLLRHVAGEVPVEEDLWWVTANHCDKRTQ